MIQDKRDMKDSGVEWLGEIPAHWEIATVRVTCDFRGGVGFPIEYQGQQEGELPFYKVSDMNLAENKSVMRRANNYINRADLIPLKAKTARKGATIFPKIGAAVHTNKKRLLGTEAVVDNNVLAIWARDGRFCDDGYLYRYFQTIHLSKLTQPGPVPTISSTELNRHAIPLPPLHEQRAIAAYLDTETARIDALITKTERLTALLREKRTALISQAVTKGLDAAAAMKDSGVEWLGEIPSHWKAVSLRWSLNIHSGESISSDEVEPTADNENRVPVIGGNGILGYTDRANTFQPTIVIGRVGAQCGNVHFILCNSWITDNALRLSIIRGFIPEYLGKLLRAYDLNRLSVSTAQPLLTGGQIKALMVVCPPLHEQRAIADRLDRETARIDALIVKNNRLIALLREKRSALISAAVTGKLAVSSVVKQ